MRMPESIKGRAQHIQAKGRKSWYSMQAKDEEADVWIYDEIGWLGVEAEQFVRDLQDLEAKRINLKINSPGGSVFDGTAIFNAIKDHPAQVNVSVDGLAASMASVIAMAGDTIRMADNAFLMIHDPWGMAIGNAREMRETADLLEKIGGTLAKTYAKRTGKDVSEIESLMAAETWMDAEEAKDMGFIDEVSEQPAAEANFDLTVFNRVPEGLRGQRDADREPTERDAERALRDAGFSRAVAKQVAAGLREDRGQREAGEASDDVIATLDKAIKLLRS